MGMRKVIVAVLCVVCSAHVRLHSLPCRALLTRTTRLAASAAEDDEIERAQRRKDEDAKKAEMTGGSSSMVDDDMQTLREYVKIVEEKEQNIAGIKQQLRSFEQVVGVRFVDDDDNILSTAWVFVGLNILVALYVSKLVLLDPLQRVLGGVP